MDHLFTLLRTLWRRKWQLVLVPASTMALIAYLTADQPKKYKTESRLFLNLQESKGVSLSDEDLKQYQVHSYFQNTIELLKSKRVIERVQLKMVAQTLDGTGHFHTNETELLANRAKVEERLVVLNEGTIGLSTLEPTDQIILRFLEANNLTTAHLKDIIFSFRVLDSNFMKLELTEESPDKVLALAQAFIECLMEENRDLAKSKIKNHKSIIEELVRQAKADLDAKIKKLEKFKVDNSIINLGEHTKAIVVYLVQLEGIRANLNAKVAAGHKGKKEVLSTVQVGNDLTLDLSGHEEILAMKQQLRNMYRQTLQTSFQTQSAPNLDAIDRQIDTKKQEISLKLAELSRKTPFDPSQVQLDLVDRYLNYDLDAETSTDMVGIINNEIQRVMSYSRRFAPFESTIGVYEQEISTAQNVYVTLLNKLNLTETIEFGSGENVISVVDPPYYPTRPEPSKRLILILAGGIAMFVLMAGGFLLIQLLDSSITTVEKFEHVSKLPVLAALPDLKDAAKKKLLEGAELIHQKQIGQMTTQLLGDSEKKVILLTSNQRGSEKSNLAKSLLDSAGGSDKRIAVVDADWTETETHAEFVNIKHLVADTAFIRNQAEIEQQIRSLADTHDVVLIITAPVHLCAEINHWGARCSSVILLVQGNRVYSKADIRAEQLLKSFSQPVKVILSPLFIENMEDFLGEIPRQRSELRKYLKKILNRNFEWSF